MAVVEALKQKAHPRIPLPRNLYGEERLNSRGVNLPDPAELTGLETIGDVGTANRRLIASPAV